MPITMPADPILEKTRVAAQEVTSVKPSFAYSYRIALPADGNYYTLAEKGMGYHANVAAILAGSDRPISSVLIGVVADQDAFTRMVPVTSQWIEVGGREHADSTLPNYPVPGYRLGPGGVQPSLSSVISRLSAISLRNPNVSDPVTDDEIEVDIIFLAEEQ